MISLPVGYFRFVPSLPFTYSSWCSSTHLSPLSASRVFSHPSLIPLCPYLPLSPVSHPSHTPVLPLSVLFWSQSTPPCVSQWGDYADSSGLRLWLGSERRKRLLVPFIRIPPSLATGSSVCLCPILKLPLLFCYCYCCCCCCMKLPKLQNGWYLMLTGGHLACGCLFLSV